MAHKIGAWYPPYSAFSVVLVLVCMVGLWKMRKWAVYVYTGFCVINQLVLLAMGVWNILTLLIPGIYIAICLANLSKMR